MLYIEIFIEGDINEVWLRTQEPQIHERWDLRFSEIKYLPKAQESDPQRFLYATKIGFGMTIQGEGESVGSRISEHNRTSALKFWSDDPRSLISEGSGYWKYISQNGGTRFFTAYDYRTRFGWIGRTFDSLAFRPLMGWATAWSFDRLRLWIVNGIEPEVSLRNSLIYAVARLTLAFIWVYEGLVPKLLFPTTGERQIVRQTGMAGGHESTIVTAVGIAEILFGVVLVVFWRSSGLLKLQTVGLALLTLGAIISTPNLLILPFNPVALNVAMIGLAIVATLVSKDLPTARNCLRKMPPSTK